MPLRRPLVISHRTNMGTAPENSLVGIRAALTVGVDGVEVDVRVTADGVPVLLHDPSFERTHGDPRRVADLTLREVAAHAAAPDAAVPTLDEALAVVTGRATLVVEVKERGIEAPVARSLRAAGALTWCWIWAFDPAVAAAFRERLPAASVWLNFSEDSGARFAIEDPLTLAVAHGLTGVSLDHRLVDARTVERAHHLGLSVAAWTVDDPSDIGRVVAMGVDAVCGDDPARILHALARA